ncbi:MAG TPA: type II and III secretion system protein, partial [Pirellulaceae bacterium]|nr:type II and III secretion system protein [Pirellulaceae bacterium]
SAADDNRRTQEVLVVQDLPGYIENIRNYIRRHDVPPRQVLIEAYILKVDLADDMRHGVDFEELFNVSSNMVQLGTTGFANAAASSGFLVNLSGGNLGAVVEMLENSADAKTLASPKIRVLNGQTARIQAGEQLGFRVTTTTQTSTTESVQFLDVGVVLEVTPRIGADGTVIMRVSPEVSSGQINPVTGLPEEKTTELQTDVMFKDNQAYVVGGLIQEVDTDTQTKLPYLGNLKYIGFFFKRAEVVKRRSEIIIALLPRVMPFDPIADEQLRMETESALTPLLYGPLLKNPRPWEPQLPGAYNNPHMLRLPPTWDYFSLQDSYDCELTAVVPATRGTTMGVVDREVRIVRTPPAHTAPQSDNIGVIDRSRITRLPPTNEVRPARGEVVPATRGTMLR